MTSGKAAALFAAGYFFGAKAGGERHAQIVQAAASVSRRLEELSARGAARRHEDSAGRSLAGA